MNGQYYICSFRPLLAKTTNISHELYTEFGGGGLFPLPTKVNAPWLFLSHQRVIKQLVKSVCRLCILVAVFLGVVNASSNSTVVSNNRSKLLAFNSNQKNYQSRVFIDISGKLRPQVVIFMFQQQGFSKQVVALVSLGNKRQKSVERDRGVFQNVHIPVNVTNIKIGQISTHCAKTANGRLLQNQRTRLKHALVAQQPAMLVFTLFFIPDSVSGSACSSVIKSALHPSYINYLKTEATFKKLQVIIEVHASWLQRPLLELLGQNVISSNDTTVYEYILKWFALIIQHPEQQTRVSMILRGRQSCGKNTFTDVLSELVSGYSLRNITSQTSVTGQFNSILSNKVFIVLNELTTFNSSIGHEVDKLKSLITDPTLEIRTKFYSSRVEKNLLNFILVSNHLDPVHLDQDDRRYLFDARIIPMTEAKKEIIEVSLTDIDRFCIQYYKQLKVSWLCDEAIRYCPDSIKLANFRLQIHKNCETIRQHVMKKNIRLYKIKEDKIAELEQYVEDDDNQVIINEINEKHYKT
ncbi:MAG: hypothetical protein EZS28_002316 [Streblomastix strix]|uniref:NrS-1 polymerase-like helicase domain-containing protein n=1 Tax=Streblomastix strix TaxID=222440 RepID=A0A5J4X4J1_9EUKA|nr:MAG: hypothetical protein EZS28_002316 [Streblomastix strix]